MTFASRTKKFAVIGGLALALTACPEEDTGVDPGVEDPGVEDPATPEDPLGDDGLEDESTS